MKYIISGTNRPGSKTLLASKHIQKIYAEFGETVDIIDLQEIGLGDVIGHYGDTAPEPMKKAIEKLNAADGLIVVTPEYNGSFPGALKYFIDHWSYPQSFEFRPVCFVGIGWMFGGLRPVEHLQGVFGYRNAFMYPERVFMMNGPKYITPEAIGDETVVKLLKSQALGFQKFCLALAGAGLAANQRTK